MCSFASGSFPTVRSTAPKLLSVVACHNGREDCAERQYASASLPPKLLVAPVVVVALTLVAWYATIFHYQPWSWVVTGFLTALSCLAIDHVFRWQSHRQRMLKVVRSPTVGWLDCLLFVVGVGFVGLALMVY